MLLLNKIHSIPSLMISRNFLLSSCRYFADAPSKKAVKAAKAGASQKREFPVETDPHRLVNYCCGSNFHKEGEDIKLKPEEEYPDWLWEIYLGPTKKLEELDPSTKAYWRRVRRMAKQRNNRMHRLKYKILKHYNPVHIISDKYYKFPKMEVDE